MGGDVVDDLHNAEDVIGTATRRLIRVARDLHLFHARQAFEDCRKEACVRVRAAIAELDGYCRPSCETDAEGRWLCGPECGCPGDHVGQHGDEMGCPFVFGLYRCEVEGEHTEHRANVGRDNETRWQSK